MLHNKGVAIIECPQEIPCNPCVAACKTGAITKASLNACPRIDPEKCVGCKLCVAACSGQAIFLQALDPAVAVADDFPDVKFIISSSDISNETNVGSINTLPADNGIMQGIAAAYMTKTNKVGAVGGADYPSITDPLNNFAAGAKYVNADIDVKLLLTYSFTDSQMAKEYTLTLIEDGCDVIMFNMDESVYGVLEAINQAKADGKSFYVIPSIYDQNSMFPDTAIMSGITDVPKSMVDIFSKVVDNTWEAKFYPYGAATGCVYYVPNDALWSNMPAEGKTALEDMLAKLTSGEIDAYEFMDTYCPADLRLN